MLSFADEDVPANDAKFGADILTVIAVEDGGTAAGWSIISGSSSCDG